MEEDEKPRSVENDENESDELDDEIEEDVAGGEGLIVRAS